MKPVCRATRETHGCLRVWRTRPRHTGKLIDAAVMPASSTTSKILRSLFERWTWFRLTTASSTETVTTAATVGDALTALHITVGPRDLVTPAPTAVVTPGLAVVVQRVTVKNTSTFVTAGQPLIRSLAGSNSGVASLLRTVTG